LKDLTLLNSRPNIISDGNIKRFKCVDQHIRRIDNNSIINKNTDIEELELDSTHQYTVNEISSLKKLKVLRLYNVNAKLPSELINKLDERSVIPVEYITNKSKSTILM
jgi:hypothetical protein